MLRKKRPTGTLISAELHEKIARSCKPIEHDPGQVLRVRSASSKGNSVTRGAVQVRQLSRVVTTRVTRLAGSHVSYGSSW